MDEATIAAQLAEKTNPIPPPAAPEPEKPVRTDEQFLHNGLPLENAVLKQQLMDYLQVPQETRHSAQVTTWMDAVLNWAATEASSHEFTDVVRVIREQEQFAGTYLKPDRLLKLNQFIKIRQARLKLAEQERALYA